MVDDLEREKLEALIERVFPKIGPYLEMSEAEKQTAAKTYKPEGMCQEGEKLFGRYCEDNNPDNEVSFTNHCKECPGCWKAFCIHVIRVIPDKS